MPESGTGGPYLQKQRLQHERMELVGEVMTVRTDYWCYVHGLYEPPGLYNRVADPRETTNLAGHPEHADVERQLKDCLLGWMLETGDVVPWQPDPRMDDLLAAFARQPL